MKVKTGVTIILIVVGVLVIAGIIAAIVFSGMARELEAFVENPQLATPDMQRIPDGTYTGEYSSGPISVKVEVTVKDHRITDCVLLKHISGQGAPADGIVDDVVKRQSLEIDTVAGATYSSTVILKAVQVALESAS